MRKSIKFNLIFCTPNFTKKAGDVDALIDKIAQFQVAIPSWALGAGGTRFGRFSQGGEPSNLEEKINDVGIIHKLTQSAGANFLHIPWDIPDSPEDIRELGSLSWN